MCTFYDTGIQIKLYVVNIGEDFTDVALQLHYKVYKTDILYALTDASIMITRYCTVYKFFNWVLLVFLLFIVCVFNLLKLGGQVVYGVACSLHLYTTPPPKSNILHDY